MMTNERLIAYIRRQIAAGVSSEDIKTALLSKGWPEDDVKKAIEIVESFPSHAGNTSSRSKVWTKVIPRINIGFLAISAALVFGLDLYILISEPDLAPFWYAMLAVFAVFLVFFYLENFVFKKKFASFKSGLDGWIVAVIIIRNIIFVMNFIPFVQLVGLATLPFAGWFAMDIVQMSGISSLSFVGWIVLIAYIALVVIRSLYLKTSAVNPTAS